MKTKDMAQRVASFHMAGSSEEYMKYFKGKLKKWKHIMNSFRKEELESPEETLNAARMERIANGSGVPIGEGRDSILLGDVSIFGMLSTAGITLFRLVFCCSSSCPVRDGSFKR